MANYELKRWSEMMSKVTLKLRMLTSAMKEMSNKWTPPGLM